MTTTIVISDTHIGDSRADRNLPALLRAIESTASVDSHLVLNGDIFDFAVSVSCDSRHREFISAARKHGRITYVVGNHDAAVGGLGKAFAPNIVFCNELRLVIGERRFEIIHGHQSDLVSNHLPRLNRWLVRLNHWMTVALGMDMQMRFRATALGKGLLRRQEDRIARRGDWAQIVVAGHTHRPAVREVGYRTYINTGDWVEYDHRSYLMIRDDGSFKLVMLGD